MKKTIELLKATGLLDKIQKNFNECKPPVGTPEETILAAIDSILDIECGLDEQFQNELADAVYADVVQAIRNELNIEFVPEEDFHKRSIGTILSALGINGNVHVHVHVGRNEEKKGKGEK